MEIKISFDLLKTSQFGREVNDVASGILEVLNPPSLQLVDTCVMLAIKIWLEEEFNWKFVEGRANKLHVQSYQLA